MNTRRTAIAILLAAAGFGLVRATPADTFTYSTVRRQIRAGIVVSKALELTKGNTVLGPENPDPHVFYIADTRGDLKPLGMEFVNPLAPAVVTSDIYQRWLNRVRPGFTDPAFVPATAQGRAFNVGSRVTKNMGAYWEVNIDNLTQQDLSQFDVLYITGHRKEADFANDVKEKLRRYIDGGGTLWVENAGGFSLGDDDGDDPFETRFLFDVQMHSGANANAGAVIAAPNHPLITYPFILTAQEIQGLGDKGVNDYYLYDQGPGIPPGSTVVGPGPNASNPPGGQSLAPIVWNTRGLAPQSPVKPDPGWRPYILAGQVGAGKLIFSSQGSGNAINDFVGGANAGYGGNSGAVSGDTLSGARASDLKFLYNLAAWTGSGTTANADVRRGGSSAEKLGAVLVDKFAAPPLNFTMKMGGAAFYKSCIFSVDGNLTLHCYDSKPGEDLDGDGNADDGIPDLITGTPYDEVWRIDLKQFAVGNPTSASTPTVIEFYDPNFIANNGDSANGLANFNQRELVIVTLSDGTTLAFRAFPRVAATGLPLAPFTVLDWKFTGGNGNPLWNLTDYPIRANLVTQTDIMPIPSPAWSEGILFVAVNTNLGGRLTPLDPRNGQGAMTIDTTGYSPSQDPTYSSVPNGNQSGNQSPAFLSSPTVGYVQDSASGAIDKMVYLHTIKAGQFGSNFVAEAIRAFWFGTKGEPLGKLSRTRWVSRADRPWYVFGDPARPDLTNPQLRPRVYRVYRDPSGNYLANEFAFVPGGKTVAASLGPKQFAVDFDANRPTVYLGPDQSDPTGQNPTMNTDADGNTYYADYTLDWSTQPGGNQPPFAARSLFGVPDIQGNGSQIGGASALSSDDMIFYNVATYHSAPGVPNPGEGVVFGVGEQFLRSTLKWAFTMHDGFSVPVNGGNPIQIPARIRQMDDYSLAVKRADYTQAVTGVQFLGSPAVANGVVYSVATGQVSNGFNSTPVTVLCAFRANPELTLRLNVKIDPGTPIRIRQPNIVNSQTSGGATTVLFVDLSPASYTIDYDSGLIHITSLGPTPFSGGGFLSTSLPFLITVGNAPEQAVYGTQIDAIANGTRELRIIGPPGIDNLLWYSVIPSDQVGTIPQGGLGVATSSPSIQGGVLWLGFSNGYIVSFDADPSATDPQVQLNGGQVRLFDAPAPANLKGHMRGFKQVTGGSAAPVIVPPMGTAGVLAVNTAAGLAAYEDTFTVIADSHRIIEVDAAGDAVWAADSTRTFNVAGGELPQYIVDPNTGDVTIGNPNNATGIPLVTNVNFARPSVVRHIGANDLLVVDTGNNRVIQMDRGGYAVWEVQRLFDDFRQSLRPGDPLSLNEPTDIQYWVETVPSLTAWFAANGAPAYSFNAPASIIHYLIADTGNSRVIELVDMYDRNGRPVVPNLNGNAAGFSMLRQLNFVSSSFGLQGRRYRYRTVQRVTIRNGDLGGLKDPSQPNNAIRLLTLSAVSNARISGVNGVGINGDDPSTAGQVLQPEAGGGSLVVLKESGDPLSIVSNLRIPNASGGYTLQPILNPTSFTAFQEATLVNNQPVVVFKYLLTDDNGAYQLNAGVDPNNNNAPVMNVEWMLSAEDYYSMTGKRLRAAAVRRLTAAVTKQGDPAQGLHHFLITNRFSGGDNPLIFGITYNTSGNPANGNIVSSADFHGEVFELDPSGFTFAQPNGHGYRQDYLAVNGKFLVPNPNANIVFRSPTETVPPAGGLGVITRTVGSPSRANSSSLLEQPAYADRPF